MKWLASFFICLASLFLCHTSQAQERDIDNIVLVKIIYKDGTFSNNETGGVLAQKAPDGSTYIITARHGFINSREGGNLSGFQGIRLYDFFGKFITTASIAFCEQYDTGKSEEWNIRHDSCILKADTPSYLDDLHGFVIPDHLSAGPIALCHSGIASWEHGASGSPVFTSHLVLQGILSETYGETYMDVHEWDDTMRAKGITPPKRLSEFGGDKPVVVASCGLFTPPSPAIVGFLGLDVQKTDWGDSPIQSGTPWENYSLPNLRGIHIKSDRIMSVDNS